MKGKTADHEHEMIRRQTDQINSASKRLKKKVGKGEGNVKAWVQSKITKAADYLLLCDFLLPYNLSLIHI